MTVYAVLLLVPFLPLLGLSFILSLPILIMGVPLVLAFTIVVITIGTLRGMWERRRLEAGIRGDPTSLFTPQALIEHTHLHHAERNESSEGVNTWVLDGLKGSNADAHSVSTSSKSTAFSYYPKSPGSNASYSISTPSPWPNSDLTWPARGIPGIMSFSGVPLASSQNNPDTGLMMSFPATKTPTTLSSSSPNLVSRKEDLDPILYNRQFSDSTKASPLIREPQISTPNLHHRPRTLLSNASKAALSLSKSAQKEGVPPSPRLSAPFSSPRLTEG